jgi:hypothetical protein
MIWLEGNVKKHVLCVVLAKLNIPHITSSLFPDLSPCGFFLFPKLTAELEEDLRRTGLFSLKETL